MIKKLLIFTLFFLGFGMGINVYAKDVIPLKPAVNQVNTIGLYQVGNDVKIYKEPSEDSQILYRIRWNNTEFFPDEIGFDRFFVVFLEKKALALVAAVDYTDDWVEIVYDNSKGLTGWIKRDDPYKFMTWINFYNTYGKKYGLTLLTGSPEYCKEIKSTTEDSAKTISTINYPKKINLSVIRGNWALISVLDLDRTPKTGYVRWRSDDGIRYFFPDLK
ncbi:MAG: hypothetical protein NC191_00890 [Muribaculaceae bacterium]|nr:hypothetical protein [Muribaculaceae bacterium]